MKIIFKHLGKVLCTLSFLLLFNSCIKKVENTTSAATGSVTIKGKVTLQGQGYADAPVYAYVSTEDYVVSPNPNIAYPNKRFVATPDKDGNYELHVDISLSNPTTIQMLVPGFTKVIGTTSTPFANQMATIVASKDGSFFSQDFAF